MIDINPDRLLADLRELASFGKAGTGVDRVAFSEIDVAARRWLAGRMQDAGLETHIDRIGNLYGRDPAATKAVLVGSHTDTVNMGGWLDGALGVIYGLEIARAAKEADPAEIGVDVVSFEDEEGTYLPCLGSLSFCGNLDETAVARAKAKNGTSLSDAMAIMGDAEAPLRCDRSRTVCYLEAHIEQGPRLEASGISLGIVTGIVGIRRFRIRAFGRADHAGTTPMAMRQDAGMGLVRLCAWIAEQFPKLGSEETVWNIGQMSFEPGAANVVPRQAEMILEFRDTETAVLDRIETSVLDRLKTESSVRLEAEPLATIEPALMSPRLRTVLENAARDLALDTLSFPSGAGHDAMIMSRVVPSAMLFVPSIGGRSHDVSENTSDADIVLGCRALAKAVSMLRAESA